MPVGVNAPKSPVTEGSNGVATATLPNICKMPGPPAPFVPTPLPNIGQSNNSPSGYSKSVKIETCAVAIQGATFKSIGDVASQGTGGGVISNNVQGPTAFVGPGSFDVAIEGKNVQFLSDQMLNNCGPGGSPANSATMSGEMQGPAQPVPTPTEIATKIACDCQKEERPKESLPKEKQCADLIDRRGKCVTRKLKGREKEGIWPNARFKAPSWLKNPSTGLPVSRLVPDVVFTAPGSFPSAMTSVGKLTFAARAGMKPGEATKIIDFKFPCPPSTKAPFPSPLGDGDGYGVEKPPGFKERKLYGDLTSPKGKVETVTPSKKICP